MASCGTMSFDDGLSFCLEADDPTLTAQLAEQQCDFDYTQFGKADVGRGVFVVGCVSAGLAARLVLGAHNGRGTRLPEAMQTKLSSHFSSRLLRGAVVHFDATLPDEWFRLAERISDDFIGGGIAAQTYGDHIFVTEPYDASRSQTALLGHEMVHVRQADERGGVVPFLRDYCNAFYESDFSYDENAMEQEAERTEARIR